MELDRIMEAAADEENRMQKFYKEQLKKSWSDAIVNKHIDKTPDFKPDSFGNIICINI